LNNDEKKVNPLNQVFFQREDGISIGEKEIIVYFRCEEENH